MTSFPKPERPIVRGAEIAFDEIVHDESFGVPAEVAEQVAAQILQALAERSIDPSTVVFSGYYDGENPHEGKETGDFGGDTPGSAEAREHTYTYIFTTAAKLPDGEEGPLAHAATGENPAIGVYSLDALTAIGYSTLHEIVQATPDEIDQALVLEFRPTYRQPEE